MEATEIRLLERRVTFVGEPSGAPFDNALIVWRRHQLHRRYLMGWNWPRVGESSRQQDTGSVPETAVQGRPASQG